MTKKIKKLNMLLLFAICLTMLFSVTAHAKSANYKKLYKKFLEKGTFKTTVVSYSSNSKNGKAVKYKNEYTYKISDYAIVNIDGKGAPELLLFSKYYSGKKPLRPNRYYVHVAAVKGKKVKIIPTYEYTTKIGKKTYKYKSYSNTFTLKAKQVKFYPALSILYFDTTYSYYDEESKKTVTSDDYETYEYKGGFLKDFSSYTDSNYEKKYETMKNTKPSVAKILKNSKKNRNKSFK